MPTLPSFVPITRTAPSTPYPYGTDTKTTSSTSYPLENLRVANLKRNNNVSLSFIIQGEGDTPTKVALVYGKAEFGFEPDEGYDEFARWVAEKYSAQSESGAFAKFDHENFVTVKVTPDKIVHFYP